MTHPNQRGDAPIVEGLRDVMNDVGRIIDGAIQESSGDRHGFILMVFPFAADDGRCNYISNAKRPDVVRLLREQLARFEQEEKK